MQGDKGTDGISPPKKSAVGEVRRKTPARLRRTICLDVPLHAPSFWAHAFAGPAIVWFPFPAHGRTPPLPDAGNTVDVTEKAAKALNNTIPFLGPVAEKLGPVGGTITAVKAVRDLYNCVN
jgi:hypothetical protein